MCTVAELKVRYLQDPDFIAAYAKAEYAMDDAMIGTGGAGRPQGHNPIRRGKAGRRAGFANGRDAAAVCEGGGEEVEGGDGVRGGWIGTPPYATWLTPDISPRPARRPAMEMSSSSAAQCRPKALMAT